MTPDRLLGRAESCAARSRYCSRPLGPLWPASLLGTVSERATIAVFAAFGLVLALWGTLSPAIRGRRGSTSSTKLPSRSVPALRP